MSLGDDDLGGGPPRFEPPGGPLGALRPDQVERWERLRALEGNGPTMADLYLDAASRLDSCTSEARLAVLAHCVREILNRLPGVMGHTFENIRGVQAGALEKLTAAVDAHLGQAAGAEGPDEEDRARTARAVEEAAIEVVQSHRRGQGENARRSRALVAGRATESRTHEPSDAAVGVVTKVRKYFTGRAHIAEKPRQMPEMDDIRRHFELVELALDLGLSQFWTGHQTMSAVRLRANRNSPGTDGRSTWSAPSDRDLDELALALQSPTNARAFFDELLNPAWFKPLRGKNLIKAPDAPIPVETGGVTFPVWPEGAYLVRIAPERPEDVTRLFLEVDLVGNGLAARQLVDAAIALPVDSAIRLTDLVIAAAREDGGWLNPERLVALAERLRQASSKAAMERLVSTLFGAPSALDDYWYKELLPRAAKTLKLALGPTAVAVLADFLHDHTAAEERDESRGWRAEIAHSREDYIFEVGNALVDATRDVSLALVRAHPDSLRAVVDALLAPAVRTGASVRIAMMVVAEAIRVGNPSAADIGQALLLDPAHLAWEYQPEYSDLGRLVLAGADQEVADAWFAIVESDPEFASADEERVHDIAARFSEVDASDVTEEHVARYRRWRQREHLALMEESLSADLAARLAALDEEFGARPPRGPWGPTVTSFVGPTSPKTTDELEAMTDDKLMDFLKEWEAPDAVAFGPSPEGLGRQLGVLAERRPERLCALADQIVELAPTYLRNIAQGWEKAVRAGGATMDWERVLAVLLFAAQQPDEGDRRYDFGEDVGWRATHQAVASLLDASLRLAPGTAPDAELRETIWSIIVLLAQSPDPSPAREATGDMDAEMTSINSVRPYAITAAVMYLWWLVQVGLITRGGDPDDTAPEVWELLTRHLDSQFDPSPAIRASLGTLFPFLASVSPSWARDSVDLLFGSGGRQADAVRADVAWAAYVRRNNPNPLMLELLAGSYRERLQRYPSDEDTKSRESAASRTAEHVLLLYINGHIELDSDDQLIAVLFSSYGPQELGQALGHLGWLLSPNRGAPSADQVERLQKLWEWRRQTVDAGGDPAELAGFGWWFRSGVFPMEWAASQLAHAASNGARIDGAAEIIKALAEHAREVTSDAVTVLTSVIDTREPWEAHWVGTNAAPIIAAGLDSDDPSVKSRANQVLQTLGASGLISLLDEVNALRSGGLKNPEDPAAPDGSA